MYREGRDSVQNLLSEGNYRSRTAHRAGIFSKAAQISRLYRRSRPEYFISLDRERGKCGTGTLPQPTLNFAAQLRPDLPCRNARFLVSPLSRPSLDSDDLNLLTTGAASQFTQTFFLPDPDTRGRDFNFQLSAERAPFRSREKKKNLPYDSYNWGYNATGSSRCGNSQTATIKNATRRKPFGLLERSLSVRDHQLHQYH